jgi:hypothetical protein
MARAYARARGSEAGQAALAVEGDALDLFY